MLWCWMGKGKIGTVTQNADRRLSFGPGKTKIEKPLGHLQGLYESERGNVCKSQKRTTTHGNNTISFPWALQRLCLAES